MIGIEKTTVRLITDTTACTATIQRLYDYGAWFKLEEEKLRKPEHIIDFLSKLMDKGGKMTRCWEFISDDDMKQHLMTVHEYVSQH
mgnify:CR=1 FL=1